MQDVPPSRIGTVHKNGSSLAVVLPAGLCRSFGIKRGDQVVIFTDKRNNIVLRKMSLEAYKLMRDAWRMEYETRDIATDLIDEPEQAMRSDIPRDAIFEMVDDIRRNGLINPITVRPSGHRFSVVAGHRRLLAHRYGGFGTVRCIVRDLSDDEAFAVMTSENLKRENVNPVDEATHTKRLLELQGGDILKVAAIVGRSREWVESRLAVAEMPDDVKVLLRTEKIKLGVALALSQITDDTDRTACLQLAVSQGISVVVAQYYLAQWRAGIFGHATEYSQPDPDAPGMQRKVIMLRCSVDGKEYPASDFVSVLVRRDNVVYIDGLREHLQKQAAEATPSPADG